MNRFRRKAGGVAIGLHTVFHQSRDSSNSVLPLNVRLFVSRGMQHGYEDDRKEH